MPSHLHVYDSGLLFFLIILPMANWHIADINYSLHWPDTLGHSVGLLDAQYSKHVCELDLLIALLALFTGLKIVLLTIGGHLLR